MNGRPGPQTGRIGAIIVPRIGSPIRRRIGSVTTLEDELEDPLDDRDDDSALDFPPTLGPEEVVARSSAMHLVAPVWRPDGNALIFVGVRTNDPFREAGNPLAGRGSIEKQDLPFRGDPRLFTRLVSAGATPATSPGFPRYSPVRIVDPVIAPGGDWLFSYFAPGSGNPTSIFVKTQTPSEPDRVFEISRTAKSETRDIAYGEWSPPGADDDDPSRFWVIHEECVPNYGLDSTVRSLVTGSTKQSVDVAYAQGIGTDLHSFEAPRFSQRTAPGWSRGWCVSMPGLPGGKFIAGAIAFGPERDPERPVTLIESGPGRERTQPQFSPDGKWISFLDGEEGRRSVVVAPFPQIPQRDAFPIRDTPETPWLTVAAPDPSRGVTDHANPQWDAGSRRLIYEKFENGVHQVYGRRIIDPGRPLRDEVRISENPSENYYHYNAENQLVSSQLRSPLTWYPSARSCLSRFLRALR